MTISVQLRRSRRHLEAHDGFMVWGAKSLGFRVSYRQVEFVPDEYVKRAKLVLNGES